MGFLIVFLLRSLWCITFLILKKEGVRKGFNGHQQITQSKSVGAPRKKSTKQIPNIGIDCTHDIYYLSSARGFRKIMPI